MLIGYGKPAAACIIGRGWRWLESSFSYRSSFFHQSLSQARCMLRDADTSICAACTSIFSRDSGDWNVDAITTCRGAYQNCTVIQVEPFRQYCLILFCRVILCIRGGSGSKSLVWFGTFFCLVQWTWLTQRWHCLIDLWSFDHDSPYLICNCNDQCWMHTVLLLQYQKVLFGSRTAIHGACFFRSVGMKWLGNRKVSLRISGLQVVTSCG